MTGAPLFAYGAAALTGAFSHIAYFNRSEHHLYGIRYLQALLITYGLGVFVLARQGEQSVPGAAASMAAIAGSYLGGLFASLLTYRVFFHPLNKFPGPFGARLSSFWLTFHVGNSEAYKTVHRLHQQHGDFVRIGSNELSIADPDAVHAIYGFGSKCTKAAWYDNDAPLTSMHTTRDRAYHDARRRVWGGAFNEKALRGYEGRVQRFSTGLIHQLGAFSGQAVDASKWFNYFSYDVMGDLAFGKSFGMLDRGEEHFAINLLNEGMQMMAFMIPAWAFRVLAAIPGAAAGYWRFINYCSSQLDERMQTKPEDPDIMSALIEPVKDRQLTDLELKMLQGDSRLIIVAGSDTTAATLTHIFYHLSASPSHQTTLLSELRPHIQPDGSLRHRDIQDLPHLNGVINEALRLHPAVPTALQRLTPPAGLDINGTHVPGGTVVWTPAYAIGRSEKAYAEPERFAPERWREGSGMVRCERAFAPFSAGVYGCIGRPLALMELRLVVAKLLLAFEVGFAPGESGVELLERSRDHFTFECGELRLCFKERVA
ncbi:putative cytochrome p450 protein [Neofusicoccum parvum]|nr:putative cytochrome p450 protein [Neofusicoccum parvum]